MKRTTKQRGVWIGVGAALGAGLMALLDPARGRRRRALIRDKATRAAHVVGNAAGKTWRDLRHRAVGVASEARRISRGGQVSDEVLVERVRSKIGHLVARPASIDVSAKAGEVILGGPVVKSELDGLLRGVRGVRGVTRLEDHLEIREEPPAQGARTGGETAEETPPPPAVRKRPAATRRPAGGSTSGGNGPTKGMILKED
jgi:hypothetical protein